VSSDTWHARKSLALTSAHVMVSLVLCGRSCHLQPRRERQREFPRLNCQTVRLYDKLYPETQPAPDIRQKTARCAARLKALPRFFMAWWPVYPKCSWTTISVGTKEGTQFAALMCF